MGRKPAVHEPKLWTLCIGDLKLKWLLVICFLWFHQMIILFSSFPFRYNFDACQVQKRRHWTAMIRCIWSHGFKSMKTDPMINVLISNCHVSPGWFFKITYYAHFVPFILSMMLPHLYFNLFQSFWANLTSNYTTPVVVMVPNLNQQGVRISCISSAFQHLLPEQKQKPTLQDILQKTLQVQKMDLTPFVRAPLMSLCSLKQAGDLCATVV